MTDLPASEYPVVSATGIFIKITMSRQEDFFTTFVDAANLYQKAEGHYRQKQALGMLYCDVSEAVLYEMTTQSGKSFSDFDDDWAQADIVLDRLAEAEKHTAPVDKEFVRLREKAESYIQGSFVVASMLPATQALVLREDFRFSAYPVSKTRGLIIGRVIGVHPRDNVMEVAPPKADIIRQGHIFHTPVIRRDDKGALVPAIRFHWLGKPSVKDGTVPEKYIETWDD